MAEPIGRSLITPPRRGAVLAAVLLLLALGAPAAGAQEGAPAVQAPLPVTVTPDPLDPGPPVPRSFLGLSFEASALGELAGDGGRGNLVRLLRSLGPGILRFGGITADQNVAWTDASTPRPPWASTVVDAAELRGIGELARRSGWRVILTVGIAHYEPAAAAREVAAARKALGPYLAAVEIGNEPDAYGKHGFRQMPWLAQGYEEEVTSYREAIAALAPGVPIAGPDVSGSGVFPEWGEEEALAQTPALLTGHHYPLGCAQTPPPSIEALLSVATRVREAQSLATYLAVARRNAIPLRVDESGSVSCGGVPGVSDTFASALWATGYIAQLMSGGAAGVNLHGHLANCAGYSPLCAPDPLARASGRLQAQPVWYALLLASALLGTRPLPTAVAGEGSPNLVVAAFSGRGHSLRVVLADDEPPGSRPLALRLQVGPGMGPATVLRLTAPSPQATSGVLLAGRAVSSGGSWRPPRRPETRRPRAGSLTVALAPSSAALVSLNPRRGSPRRSR